MKTQIIKNKLIKILPELSGLRVLMYHKFSKEKQDILTVKESQFNEQLLYLIDEGYKLLKITDLYDILQEKREIPKKSFMLTMDDAYVNNLEIADPILAKLKLKALMFLPVQWLGKKNEWDQLNDPLLSIDQLKNLNTFQFGLHSYSHKNYTSLSLEEVSEDLKQAITTLTDAQLPFEKILAYPYGAYPKNDFLNFKNVLMKHEIQCAFRIGNSIIQSINEPYLIQRIDIQGTDSFDLFKLKMKWGKYKF